MHPMVKSTLNAMNARIEIVRQIAKFQPWSGPELTREQVAECHRIIRDTCAAFGVTPHEAGYESELCTNGCCATEGA